MANKSERCQSCEVQKVTDSPLCDSCHVSDMRGTLADSEISHLLERGIIVIDPILKLSDQLTPAGIDLRLDVYFRELLQMKIGIIDLGTELPEREFYRLRELDLKKQAEEYYFIQPGDFVLAQSLEFVLLPNFICGRLGGRSSLAKSGVEVHATSERVDPGFSGHLTLELKNVGKMPVKLYPLQRIANIVFETTLAVSSPYGGAFQHQVRIKPPKPDKDLVRWLNFLHPKSPDIS